MYGGVVHKGDITTICWVTALFLPVSCVFMQERINSVCGKMNTDTKDKNVAEEIKQLKPLLDDGYITQEEFDAKKKQILGL